MKNLNQQLVTKLSKKLAESEKLVELQAKEIEVYKKEIKGLKGKVKNIPQSQENENQWENLRNFFIQKNIQMCENMELNSLEINSLCDILLLKRNPIKEKKTLIDKKEKLKKLNLQDVYEKFHYLNENYRKLQKLNKNKFARQQNIVSLREQGNKITFVFFKNGIKINGFPFMLYKHEDTMQLMLDILEGFYPSILQSKYPTGVELDLEDKMDNVYDPITDEINKEKFMEQIPSKIIDKNGEIIDVKKGIEEQFLKDTLKNRILDQELRKTLRSQLENSQMIEEQNNDCDLKIRTLKKIIFLSINKEKTLKELYQILTKQIVGPFILEKNYPKEELNRETQGSMTMENLGLSPQSALNLRLL